MSFSIFFLGWAKHLRKEPKYYNLGDFLGGIKGDSCPILPPPPPSRLHPCLWVTFYAFGLRLLAEGRKVGIGSLCLQYIYIYIYKHTHKACPIQMSQELREFCRDKIEDLLNKGIIRKSKSPWIINCVWGYCSRCWGY